MTEDKTSEWPLNSNAVGQIFGMIMIALSSEQRSIALGLGICLMFCTSQICRTIRDAR